MKTKEDVIKQAYGEYWEFVKDYVDENGWVKSIDFLMCNSPIAYESFHNKNGFFYNRPKSLHGIENNHGWIKIESEEDLPKENGTYFTKTRQDDKIRIEVMCVENLDEKGLEWYKNHYTHYQPIEKPKLPIY